MSDRSNMPTGWRFAWSGWPLVDERNLPDVPDGGSTLALLGVGLAGLAARRLRGIATAALMLAGISAQAVSIEVLKVNLGVLDLVVRETALGDSLRQTVTFGDGGGGSGVTFHATSDDQTFVMEWNWDGWTNVATAIIAPNGDHAWSFSNGDPVINTYSPYGWHQRWEQPGKIPDGGGALAFLGVGLVAIGAWRKAA